MLTGYFFLATDIRSQLHVPVIQTSLISQDATWISGATTHVVPEEKHMMSPRVSASTRPTKRLAQQQMRRSSSSRARAKHTHILTTTMPIARESVLADQRRAAWGRLRMDVLEPLKWDLVVLGDLFLSSHQGTFWAGCMGWDQTAALIRHSMFFSRV